MWPQMWLVQMSWYISTEQKSKSQQSSMQFKGDLWRAGVAGPLSKLWNSAGSTGEGRARWEMLFEELHLPPQSQAALPSSHSEICSY